MIDEIKITGAREHNLKNISVSIPKNKFVVITGVSGSGKSSLAFDTLYAEGQRRYVESLSSYARQFLGIMDKPDVDNIEGLSPSISIDQKTTSQNPRSTVGTITEIYDYLRLLFARIGHPHCSNCKSEIKKLSLDEIVFRTQTIIENELKQDKIKPHKFLILSPAVIQKKGQFKELFENLITKGYSKIFIDKKEFELSKDINLIKTNKHDIEVVIDELSLTYNNYKNNIYNTNFRSRLSNSIEQSLALSDGLVILKNKQSHLFSEDFSCSNCNISLPELEPRMFSFNSPIGACKKCKGLGNVYKINEESILNNNFSINEGGILPFNKIYFLDSWYLRLFRQAADEYNIDLNKPIKDLDKKDLDILLYGTKKMHKVKGKNRFGQNTVITEVFDGIIGELERRFFNTDKSFKGLDFNKFIKEEVCESCEGKKLKKEILSITIDEKNITEFADESIINLLSYIRNGLDSKLIKYEKQISSSITKEIETRLNFLDNVGLSYLTLSRSTKSLSGGEAQRIRLASQIGTGLTGVLYVLDEPSIGLHQKDISALIKTLRDLTKLGNTLVVVEHDQTTMESSDYLIELGPKAGENGGNITFKGTINEIKKSKSSITGQYLSGRKNIKLNESKLQVKKGNIKLSKAAQFNLKNVDLNLPLGNLIAITGVSGSGKSTLIVETLYPALKYFIEGHFSEKIGKFENLEGFQYLDKVYLVDQSPIGRTPRSNPATYIGIFDGIREIYASSTDAKIRGFNKGRFSFNLKGGRCEKCQGAGVIKIEMQFLADVYIKCDVCNGQRYNKETLDVKYKDLSIYDILKMTVDEAREFFTNFSKVYDKLVVLQEVGLGYIKLGQPAPTLSGGEAQRVKLANELSKKGSNSTLYILDEPTTGLHFYDVEKLLHSLQKLVNKGNTVIIIEHNLDVIKNSQYVVDLGPEGGDNGGHIVFQGQTKNIIKSKKSYTAEYLKKYFIY
ncbi:MAG: excinuclease ABC subunit UvrA [bacterium]